MLVLSRSLGQKIMIGNDIEVVVLGIGKSQIRLGISAPINVEILRDNAVVRYAKEDRND